ncbi:MAG: NUDIX hydrolase [Minisyncoccia bacterium]
MKLLSKKVVNLNNSNLNVSIFKIESDSDLFGASRVYVLGVNKGGSVCIIFNAKRKIWGFPGGHIDEGESVTEAIKRESMEECGYSLEIVEPKFVIENVVDDKVEKQVICFGRFEHNINKLNAAEGETVTDVRFVNLSELNTLISLPQVWSEIIEEFELWLKNT